MVKKQDRTIYRVRYVFEGEDMTEDFCYDPWDKMAYDEAFFTYLAMFRGDIDDAEVEITDPKWDRHLTLPYKRSDYSGLVCSCDMDGYDEKDYTLDSFG